MNVPSRPPIFRRLPRFDSGRGLALLVASSSLVMLSQSTTVLAGPQSASAAVTEAASAPFIARAEQIPRWIKELADDAYSVRQEAQQNLLASGRIAREPLLSLVNGPDPEVRAAARRLVTLIAIHDFRSRLVAFAADRDGREKLSMPGWEQFSQLVGSDPRARALFVEMQRHESTLLAAVFREDAPRRGPARDEWESSWEERLVQLVQWQSNTRDKAGSPPLGSAASFLFVGSLSDGKVSDRAALQLANLVARPPLQTAVQAGDHHDATRRLVSAWIIHCPSQTEASLQQRLYLIGVLKLDEALPLALDVIAEEAGTRRGSPMTSLAAVLVVGQVGRLEHVEKLEPLLEDETVCVPAAGAPRAGLPPNPNVQLRDVALVTMLHLTGQRPADYHYLHTRRQGPLLYQPQSLYPRSSAHRKAAIDKWRQWKAARDVAASSGQ